VRLAQSFFGPISFRVLSLQGRIDSLQFLNRGVQLVAPFPDRLGRAFLCCGQHADKERGQSKNEKPREETAAIPGGSKSNRFQNYAGRELILLGKESLSQFFTDSHH
jgi:hypothetical protein